MDNPRILVGMVTSRRHHYCQDSAIYSILHQSYGNFDWKVIELSKSDDNYNYLKRRYDGHIIKGKWFETGNERTANGREMIRQIAIKDNFDYIFFMDADWVIPKNTLEKLLSHEKDLVGVLYNYGKGRLSFPSIAKSGNLIYDGIRPRVPLDRLDLYTWEEIFELSPAFIKCYGAGIGLVSRKVFTQIPWRHSPNWNIGDDVQYWHECNDKGFQFWADLSFKVTHLNVTWDDKIVNEEVRIENDKIK